MDSLARASVPGVVSVSDSSGTILSPVESEVCDLQRAADIYNQQEDTRTDLQRLMSNGRCRNPHIKCSQARRPEAVVDEYGWHIQWEQCPACGYCDDGPN